MALQKNVYPVANLRGRKTCGHLIAEGFGDQSATQDGDHVLSHDLLLLHTAMVLQRQDHRIFRRLSKNKTTVNGKEDKLFKSQNKYQP